VSEFLLGKVGERSAGESGEPFPSDAFPEGAVHGLRGGSRAQDPGRLSYEVGIEVHGRTPYHGKSIHTIRKSGGILGACAILKAEDGSSASRILPSDGERAHA
jgi:hypothetical protein